MRYAWLSLAALCAWGQANPVVRAPASLTSGAVVVGGGSQNVAVSSLTGSVLKSTSGVLSAATPGTDYVVPAGNVATATALAADPTDCSTNQPSIGIAASGTATCMTLSAAVTKSTSGVFSAATTADVSGVSYVAGGGTAQAQTATLSPALAAMAAGVQVCWLPAAANSGAGPTLAVNGLTATTITKYGTTALAANDITTTAVACVIHDGTRWQLQNPQTNNGTVTSVGFTGGLISVATGTTTPAFTVAGTSGGIPYFSGASTWASSGALAANKVVLGGGAGVAPSTSTLTASVVSASSGVLSAATTTGSGSVVLGTSPTIATPTITTSATAPLVIGGTGTTSTLTLRSTSGVGATGADIIFQAGNNGATEVMRLQNGGNVGIGAAPTYLLDIQKTTGEAVFRSLAGTVDFRSYASQAYSVGYAGMFSNHDFLVIQNSLERMRISSTGINVGNANPTDANFAVVSTGTAYVPLKVQHTASSTNDAPVAFQLARLSSGTPAAGMGSTMQFLLQDAGGSQIVTHQLVSAWSDPAAANRETSLRINYSKANVNYEALRIDTNGNTLIGYTSSNGSYKLQVNSQIFATSSTIATSDANYKTDVADITQGLDVIERLKPVTFLWKQHPVHDFDTETRQIGFLAQDVKIALKDRDYADAVVKKNKIRVGADDEEFLGMVHNSLLPLMVKSIQELAEKVRKLEAGGKSK